jgi:hypothetical protein
MATMSESRRRLLSNLAAALMEASAIIVGGVPVMIATLSCLVYMKDRRVLKNVLMRGREQPKPIQIELDAFVRSLNALSRKKTGVHGIRCPM